jgi:hypothetical protein
MRYFSIKLRRSLAGGSASISEEETAKAYKGANEFNEKKLVKKIVEVVEARAPVQTIKKKKEKVKYIDTEALLY